MVPMFASSTATFSQGFSQLIDLMARHEQWRFFGQGTLCKKVFIYTVYL